MGATGALSGEVMHGEASFSPEGMADFDAENVYVGVGAGLGLGAGFGIKIDYSGFGKGLDDTIKWWNGLGKSKK